MDDLGSGPVLAGDDASAGRSDAPPLTDPELDVGEELARLKAENERLRSLVEHPAPPPGGRRRGAPDYFRIHRP